MTLAQIVRKREAFTLVLTALQRQSEQGAAALVRLSKIEQEYIGLLYRAVLYIGEST